MPIDDLRTRAPAARPVADEDAELEDVDDEPSPTPERLAEIEAAHNAEAVRRLMDLDEGRVQAIPLEEALAYIFAKPTAEELAELPPRRAHDDEPSPTPERLAEIEAAWIAEAQEAIKAIDEGREQMIPWEAARALIFAPPRPEELATSRPPRARR